MFSKVAILATLSLALSVIAAPSGNDYECNTSNTYCCNSVQQSQSAAGAEIFKTVVGLVAQDFTGFVGATCSPLTVIGVAGGASCSQQPVCCKDNYSNGLVVANCNPINVSL